MEEGHTANGAEMSAKTKRANCETCNWSHSYFTAGWGFNNDGKYVDVWKCQGCGFELPRRTNKAGPGMTPSQVAAVTGIKARLLANANEGGAAHELKSWDTELFPGGRVYVQSCTGMVGDEGTLAEAFCRDHRHFVVGRRGRVELLNAKNGKKVTGPAVYWALT